MVATGDDTWRTAGPELRAMHDWTDDKKRLVFRSRLQEHLPFQRFYDFVARGMSSGDAAVRAGVLFDLAPAPTGPGNYLAEWGLYAGIFIKQSGALSLAVAPVKPDLAQELRTLRGIERALADDLSARCWIEGLLGQDAFAQVPPEIIASLVKSLRNHLDDPDTALREAGIALEDALKWVAAVRGVPLITGKKRIDQISQLVQALRSNGALADKHVNTLEGLATFLYTDVLQGYGAYRNMPSHGKNVEEDQRWELGPEIALCISVQTVLAIRSLYWYVVHARLTF
jgi:hypothetical protein